MVISLVRYKVNPLLYLHEITAPLPVKRCHIAKQDQLIRLMHFSFIFFYLPGFKSGLIQQELDWAQVFFFAPLIQKDPLNRFLSNLSLVYIRDKLPKWHCSIIRVEQSTPSDTQASYFVWHNYCGSNLSFPFDSNSLFPSHKSLPGAILITQQCRRMPLGEDHRPSWTLPSPSSLLPLAPIMERARHNSLTCTLI